MKVFKKGIPLWYAAIIFICGIAVNLLGYFVAQALVLPFWLDTIGTGIVSCILGPTLGAFAGLLSNLLMGLDGSFSAYYCCVNVGIGIIIGLLARHGKLDDVFSVMCASIVVAVFSTICGTPFNLFLYNAKPGNVWGAALFDMLGQYGLATGIKTVLAQAFIDVPDKVISMLAVFGIVTPLRKIRFKPSDSEVAENEK